MAPMVATMMAETMPAPRWMPNWGCNKDGAGPIKPEKSGG